MWKTEDGTQLLRAQQKLIRTIRHLELFQVVPFAESAAAEFDRLRQNRKLRKIGRRDLLIAAITLANRATLVTRIEALQGRFAFVLRASQ
ncbi:MAG: type II toxin-antitoxin system VapC family toxin [Gemmataceae bacterium]